MPELPEVETVCRGLRPLMVGNTFKHVCLRRPDLRIPFPSHFERTLEGVEIKELKRKAKYIQIFLATKKVLLIHLGMSGRLEIEKKDQSLPRASTPHDHVIFEFATGDKLYYRDPRRFGLMVICEEGELDGHRFFKHLGPEPLSPLFTPYYLTDILKDKKGPIKSLLLDQKNVVGLGNIYVCEALYRSMISPLRPSGSLSQKETEILVPILKQVLEEAIAAGGSTLRDHLQPNGELGYFQHTFQVYGREGKPCLRCGADYPIHRRLQAGRSTFFCVSCQK